MMQRKALAVRKPVTKSVYFYNVGFGDNVLTDAESFGYCEAEIARTFLLPGMGCYRIDLGFKTEVGNAGKIFIVGIACGKFPVEHILHAYLAIFNTTGHNRIANADTHTNSGGGKEMLVDDQRVRIARVRPYAGVAKTIERVAMKEIRFFKQGWYK